MGVKAMRGKPISQDRTRVLTRDVGFQSLDRRDGSSGALESDSPRVTPITSVSVSMVSGRMGKCGQHRVDLSLEIFGIEGVCLLLNDGAEQP